MKLTRKHLKKLILEEMEQPQAADKQNLQALRKKMLTTAQNLTGIQQNELEMINLFIDMIDLAKKENINVSEFKRRLGMVKDAAEKIAK